MPTTRSAANGASGSSSRRSKARSVTVDSNHSEGDDGEFPGMQNVQRHLRNLTESFSTLKDEIKALKKRNGELEEEVAQSNDRTETSRRHGGNKADSAIVQELEEEVNLLKAENRKKGKIIEKLKAKELKDEAEDLLDTVPDPETGMDAAARMRKLLRRFNDLMLVTTLGDEDSCPICLDEMECEKCTAFNCQHLVCTGCFKKILPNEDEGYRCPTCRQVTPRDEMELVHMTEQARWDSLLKVAEAWAAFDHRPEEETSEEEDEENFLADDATSEGNEDDDEEEKTPPPGERQPYSQSPLKEKRKRMEELARQKKRRL